MVHGILARSDRFGDRREIGNGKANMAEQSEDKTWPPPEKVDERAIVHIEEGAKGSTLFGTGALVESASDES